MASKHDIVINELDYKVKKLIKLYISSLERNRSLEDRLVELQDELERGAEREADDKRTIENSQGGGGNLVGQRKCRGKDAGQPTGAGNRQMYCSLNN